MSGEQRDRASARRTALALGALVLALGGIAVWGIGAAAPAVQGWMDQVFAPGIGLKTAAIIAVVVSVVLLLVMTAAAGDGLLGEVQFVIPGFFLFFVFFWLMTAWVF